MACPDYLKFKGVSNFSDSLLTTRLETNLVQFLNWGFLEIGGFFNANMPASGAYGGDFTKLRRVSDPSYTDYTVYETPRKDIVWETGIEYTGGSPIQVSGVYVNDVFYAPSDATYGHKLDYPNGRILFNNALTSADTVKLEHSYRWVQVHKPNNAPWFRKLQYESFRVDDTSFNQAGSGNWDILGHSRVQLPCVIVECVPRRSFKPFEVGNQMLTVKQDVLFHVLAEDKWSRDQVQDVLSLQHHKIIVGFNPDTIPFPLDSDGALVGTAFYPTWVAEGSSHRWTKIRFEDCQITSVESPHPNLYESTVKITCSFEDGAVT
jgi:hypothetical protein